MTPDICKECKKLEEGGGCRSYANCGEWRRWFRMEWSRIHRAGLLLMAISKREERGQNGEK